MVDKDDLISSVGRRGFFTWFNLPTSVIYTSHFPLIFEDSRLNWCCQQWSKFARSFYCLWGFEECHGAACLIAVDEPISRYANYYPPIRSDSFLFKKKKKKNDVLISYLHLILENLLYSIPWLKCWLFSEGLNCFSDKIKPLLNHVDCSLIFVHILSNKK